jgi:hypothetical protein
MVGRYIFTVDIAIDHGLERCSVDKGKQYTARARFLAFAILSHVDRHRSYSMRDVVELSIDLVDARHFEKHPSPTNTAPQYLCSS